MDEVMYEEIHRLEQSNWWFVGMRRIADSLLGATRHQFARALDVGCGSGGNLALLNKHARHVVALDVSDKALRRARAEARDVVAADALKLPFADASFDLVNLFNVVEHLADDDAALGEIRRVLAPGGTLLLATSAYRALWSDHDEVNQHYRRYERGELLGVLRRAGFHVDRATHANAALVAPTLVVAAARRNALKLGLLKPYEKSLLDVPGPANAALTTLLTLEAKLLERVDLPTGVSLFALARRPG